jgi:hypothetical protein
LADHTQACYGGREGKSTKAVIVWLAGFAATTALFSQSSQTRVAEYPVLGPNLDLLKAQQAHWSLRGTDKSLLRECR